MLNNKQMVKLLTTMLLNDKAVETTYKVAVVDTTLLGGYKQDGQAYVASLYKHTELIKIGNEKVKRINDAHSTNFELTAVVIKSNGSNLQVVPYVEINLKDALALWEETHDESKVDLLKGILSGVMQQCDFLEIGEDNVTCLDIIRLLVEPVLTRALYY